MLPGIMHDLQKVFADFGVHVNFSDFLLAIDQFLSRNHLLQLIDRVTFLEKFQHA